jgi:hypothetical protein
MQENGTSVLRPATCDLEVSGMAQCIVRNMDTFMKMKVMWGPGASFCTWGPVLCIMGMGWVVGTIHLPFGGLIDSVGLDTPFCSPTPAGYG